MPPSPPPPPPPNLPSHSDLHGGLDLNHPSRFDLPHDVSGLDLNLSDLSPSARSSKSARRRHRRRSSAEPDLRSGPGPGPGPSAAAETSTPVVRHRRSAEGRDKTKTKTKSGKRRRRSRSRSIDFVDAASRESPLGDYGDDVGNGPDHDLPRIARRRDKAPARARVHAPPFLPSSSPASPDVASADPDADADADNGEHSRFKDNDDEAAAANTHAHQLVHPSYARVSIDVDDGHDGDHTSEQGDAPPSPVIGPRGRKRGRAVRRVYDESESDEEGEGRTGTVTGTGPGPNSGKKGSGPGSLLVDVEVKSAADADADEDEDVADHQRQDIRPTWNAEGREVIVLGDSEDEDEVDFTYIRMVVKDEEDNCDGIISGDEKETERDQDAELVRPSRRMPAGPRQRREATSSGDEYGPAAGRAEADIKEDADHNDPTSAHALSDDIDQHQHSSRRAPTRSPSPTVSRATTPDLTPTPTRARSTRKRTSAWTAVVERVERAMRPAQPSVGLPKSKLSAWQRRARRLRGAAMDQVAVRAGAPAGNGAGAGVVQREVERWGVAGMDALFPEGSGSGSGSGADSSSGDEGEDDGDVGAMGGQGGEGGGLDGSGDDGDDGSGSGSGSGSDSGSGEDEDEEETDDEDEDDLATTGYDSDVDSAGGTVLGLDDLGGDDERPRRAPPRPRPPIRRDADGNELPSIKGIKDLGFSQLPLTEPRLDPRVLRAPEDNYDFNSPGDIHREGAARWAQVDAINFQRIIIMLVVRYRNGAAGSHAPLAFLEHRYFREAWDDMHQRTHSAAQQLELPSWLTLRADYQTYVDIDRIDPISNRDDCTACGRDHAYCWSYSEVWLGGGYDGLTFAPKISGDYQQSEVMGTDCFKAWLEAREMYHLVYLELVSFEKDSFVPHRMHPRLRAMLHESKVDVDAIVAFFQERDTHTQLMSGMHAKVDMATRRRQLDLLREYRRRGPPNDYWYERNHVHVGYLGRRRRVVYDEVN